MNMIKFSDLCPGDVLLCKGEGWISDLIVLFDGGPYSHSALYVGIINGEHSVIQATGSGIKCCFLKSLEEEVYTDVFRFNKSNHRIDSKDYPFDPIYNVANGYVAAGTQYAYDHLLLLAILGITRDIPLEPMTKQLVRIVLDNAAAFIFKLLDEGKTPMVCSELVYRCFDEADINKKYQLNISTLSMSDLLQNINELINNPSNDNVEDIELLNSKKNFIEAWNRAEIAAKKGNNFSINPVAACVTPRDLKDSSDLKIIGRLSYK